MFDHRGLVEADRDDVVTARHPDRQGARPDDAAEPRSNCRAQQQRVRLEREVQLEHLTGTRSDELLTDDTSYRIAKLVVRLGFLVKPNQPITGAQLSALGQNGRGNLRRSLGATQFGRLSNGSCIGH